MILFASHSDFPGRSLARRRRETQAYAPTLLGPRTCGILSQAHASGDSFVVPAEAQLFLGLRKLPMANELSSFGGLEHGGKATCAALRLDFGKHCKLRGAVGRPQKVSHEGWV